MTTTQTREAARTPADAQSAASRRATAQRRSLLTLMLAWLGFAGAAGIIAALMAATGRDPSWCLGVLALGWHALTPGALPKRGGAR